MKREENSVSDTDIDASDCYQ